MKKKTIACIAMACFLGAGLSAEQPKNPIKVGICADVFGLLIIPGAAGLGVNLHAGLAPRVRLHSSLTYGPLFDNSRPPDKTNSLNLALSFLWKLNPGPKMDLLLGPGLSYQWRFHASGLQEQWLFPAIQLKWLKEYPIGEKWGFRLQLSLNLLIGSSMLEDSLIFPVTGLHLGFFRRL